MNLIDAKTKDGKFIGLKIPDNKILYEIVDFDDRDSASDFGWIIFDCGVEVLRSEITTRKYGTACKYAAEAKHKYIQQKGGKK